ncbi:hypothetical protein PybrP1_005458 [[Pythium] brassicae (nom. inval.)]|nr:hypothetical protein PybrP1_005458 [[Pythium] brassicae (nom. inval.)]
MRLRQVQVVHRHGDRTPLRNVFRGARGEEAEAQRWEPMLPLSEQLAQLRGAFRVATAQTPAQSPLQTRPFGFLTRRGIEQMHARGVKLRALGEREGLPFASLNDADVRVMSNAYMRTQLSAQALLHGLLGDELRLAPRVHVLAQERDMINTYASFPEIATLKAALETESEELAFREHAMAPRKQELARLLPLFAAGCEPFTWMTTADYFVCRTAHAVPLIPGTEAHGDAAQGHLSFRFHQFYSNPRILQLVVGRLIQNVLVEMQRVMADESGQRRLVVYSGHDISILSVLHAVDAARADDQSWWPEYSSAVALELLQDEHSGRWFVRCRLDDDVLARRGADNSALVPFDEFGALIADKLRGFVE